MTRPAQWPFQDSPVLLAALDDELVCRHASQAWLERLQATTQQDEVVIPLAEMFALDDQPELAEQLDELLRKETQIHEVPVSLQGKTGITRGLLSAWRSRGEDGRLWLYLTATCSDELNLALQELQRMRTRHELILNAAGEGIYGLDCEGRTTFGNTATREILGWDPDNIMGKKAHDVHHHSHSDGSPYPRSECPIYAALRDGEVHRVDDEVFWHTNGSAVPVEYTSTPIWEDGKPNGAVVVFRDISQRREIERQREAAFQEIKQLKEQLELERDYLRDEIKVASNFGEIIGVSQALKRTLAQIEAVAATPASVLVLGESGVGKEMVARAIHAGSERADKPLIKVNCASIPKDLFESEFFGHVKGAFTGAHRDRVGRLQLADGGTLFLDEVGEIPLNQQGKLLRALQEHEFEAVGDDRTVKVDVRVVAATNHDLEKEAKAGRFREDLFYRLSVFPIEVPPLRERTEDIAALAQHFLERSCAEMRRDPLRLSKQQVEGLQRQRWPGNIRELKNVIERAVILSKGTQTRLDLAMPDQTNASMQDLTEAADAADFVSDAQFRELEKANMIAALQHSNWRIWGSGGAAELLGLKPSTLTYRMKIFHIHKGE